jgi:preprotein translocase subunit SecE
MSREHKRRVEQEKRKAEQRTTPVEEEVDTGPAKERAGVGQYVGEVRSELRRVHWPNRKELSSYAVVVIVAVALMTAFIYGMDEIFSRLVFAIFG